MYIVHNNLVYTSYCCSLSLSLSLSLSFSLSLSAPFSPLSPDQDQGSPLNIDSIEVSVGGADSSDEENNTSSDSDEERYGSIVVCSGRGDRSVEHPLPRLKVVAVLLVSSVYTIIVKLNEYLPNAEFTIYILCIIVIFLMLLHTFLHYM